MDVAPKHIGRFFIVSFPEDKPRDETLHFLIDNNIGGIILFAGHCRDQDSLKSWLADFKKSLGRPFIVAVDQEGGRVRRFGSGFPSLESPRYYGHRRRFDDYRSDLARVCERLYEIGINMNLVPTVDLLDTDPGHVLDTRTFSDDPDVVSRFADETIRIHHREGLLTCAKHFPGLGRSFGDPHEILSTADHDEDSFREIEIPPFRAAIESGVDTVMVTHLSAPKIDPKPAIVSEKIISGWLKDNLAFTGPVITDDLLMMGASDIDPSPNLASESFAAGADILLFGQDLKKIREMYRSFEEAWEDMRFEKPREADAWKRVQALLKRIP
jgi:beta-glucosidase-like glycosyl hydrolase